MKARTVAELQVHDLMLDADPDQHPADCPICEDRAPATNDLSQEPTVDEAALQRQIDQLSADLNTATSTIEDLRTQLADKDNEAQIKDLEAERDQAVKDKEDAEAALDSVQTEFNNFKQGIEDAENQRAEDARLEELATERAGIVSDLGYSETFVTETRAKGWAKMSDADWDERLAELTETKPKASDKVDPEADPDKTVIDGAKDKDKDKDADKVTDADKDDKPASFAEFLRNRDKVATL